MGSETEPAKLLLPYLQRADELQKHEPLVAYYCRLYAMDRGLRIPQKERTKTTNAILVSLMNQLEKDKKAVKLGPEDNLYVEGFASNVFAKADKQDRAGRADLSTAKTFYAASIFFEILNQFGELQPDIEQKQKYSVWKAAEIRKALKEGRRPEPGPPGGDKDLLLPPSPSTNTYDQGPSESIPSSRIGGDSSSQHIDMDLGRRESFSANYTGVDPPTSHVDDVNPFGSTPTNASPSTYLSPDHTSSNFHQPPPPSRLVTSPYPQPYQQPFTNEQHSIPQNYQPPENPSPSFPYPNFQSYPSFQDSAFPAAPSHQPSYFQDPDMVYSHQSPPPPASIPSAASYDSVNGNHAGPSPTSTASFKYDPNYLPPAEKITEAHKAARFAVGALAFDDVPVAVDFLRRSLELLTNPSAESH